MASNEVEMRLTVDDSQVRQALRDAVLTDEGAVGIARQAVADGLLALAETYEGGPHTDDNGYARHVMMEASAAVHDGTLPALIARREKGGRWPVNILDAADPKAVTP
jgi:hypothetical protein